LHDMCGLLRALPKSCKIMIQYDHVFLYTNQLTTLEYMSRVEYIDRWLIGQAVVVYP